MSDSATQSVPRPLSFVANHTTWLSSGGGGGSSSGGGNSKQQRQWHQQRQQQYCALTRADVCALCGAGKGWASCVAAPPEPAAPARCNSYCTELLAEGGNVAPSGSLSIHLSSSSPVLQTVPTVQAGTDASCRHVEGGCGKMRAVASARCAHRQRASRPSARAPLARSLCNAYRISSSSPALLAACLWSWVARSPRTTLNAMAASRLGLITVKVSTAPIGGSPSVSGTYRNCASVDALPTTYNGCATLYELFNKAVDEHGDNRRAPETARERGRPTALQAPPPPPPLPASPDTSCQLAAHLAGAWAGGRLQRTAPPAPLNSSPSRRRRVRGG